MKKKFMEMKSGEFFKWKRKLYIKTNWSHSAVQISNGFDIDCFEETNLISPVKVKINIIK